jgi:DNA polymerase III subunit epsilon
MTETPVHNDFDAWFPPGDRTAGVSPQSKQSKARETGVVWARRLMELDDFLVLDTETTGLSGRDQIVQIAVINKRGEALLDALIKPTIPIPPAVSLIHGIKDEHVVNAPSFPDVFAAFSKLLDGRPLVIYNASFDVRMLQQDMALWKLPEIQLPCECAMKAYSRYYGEQRKGGRSFTWKSLKFACETEGIERVHAHWAINDCRMTLALVRKMAGGSG